MAAPRKSSVALAARERARAQAEEITRRNEELIELAAQFFVQDDHATEIDDDLERKIHALREQADAKKAAAQDEASTIVQLMIATGESKKSIAERLGLSPADLKRFIPTAPKSDDGSLSDAEDQTE
jgi:transcriptional regulator with GAF, ATPase, and Fis domain